MAKGTSYNYPAEAASRQETKTTTGWEGRYPGPADLCFNYRKLIEQPYAITTEQPKICIVGGGITGLTAARELLRCGFQSITVIEQSKRIGGRHLTVFPGNEDSTHKFSPFEMGAMRMPLFNKSGEPPEKGQSLMAYYSHLFGLKLSDFPNPGSPVVGSTGIFLREGKLDNIKESKTLIWRNPNGSDLPPSETLKRVHAKWDAFAKQMVDVVSVRYGTEIWEATWKAVVAQYHDVSFRNFVVSASKIWDEKDQGDFGGLGMTQEESDIFYSVGIGDGSWGAFYELGCLVPIRAAIFGFNSQLQLVHGRLNKYDELLSSPHLGCSTIKDSMGVEYEPPQYLGLASLAECMLYIGSQENEESFYSHSFKQGSGLLMDSSVTKITKLASKKIDVEFTWQSSDPDLQQQMVSTFDIVILTVPSWIIGTKIKLEGFTEEQLPFGVYNEFVTGHWDSSCKVYAPLRKEFMDKNRDPVPNFNVKEEIPQIMVTDTFIHDVYAYRYNDHYQYDSILLSYTWEDDTLKLSGFTDSELIDACINELDRILAKSKNIGALISPFIVREHAIVQKWISDKNSRGCSKLYRAGSYYSAMKLLTYNRKYSKSSGLYLAGESFSVDGGWTEPCLRGAVDTVINICANYNADFTSDFNFEKDYPHYYD